MTNFIKCESNIIESDFLKSSSKELGREGFFNDTETTLYEEERNNLTNNLLDKGEKNVK